VVEIDGSIAPQSSAGVSPAQPTAPTTGRRDACPTLIFSSDTPFVGLYWGNCLELLTPSLPTRPIS
jgi:hypothetical protein